ncbi:unnamed protein product [Knipowitschia caucasica]
MKACLCLLVCVAAAVWVRQSLAAPRRSSPFNLKTILDKIDNYDHVRSKGKWLASVRNFTEGHGRCGDSFFCAVHGIFHKHSNATNEKQDRVILANLENYIKQQDLNCTSILPSPLNTTVWYQTEIFLDDVKMCINCRNLNNTTTSC